MSQNIGGHSPTNSARRSALPRSSWSTVFARIQSVMQSQMVASEQACKYQPRRPHALKAFVSMAAGYPRKGPQTRPTNAA